MDDVELKGKEKKRHPGREKNGVGGGQGIRKGSKRKHPRREKI